MIHKEIFRKDINRTIEGVIKADDVSNLKEEVKEYVFTNEIIKELDHDFLDEYGKRAKEVVANGVWISGFFGSGKSHLLKMLSLLLENRTLDDLSVREEFTANLDDGVFKENILKASAIESESILFNIFQKHKGISYQTDNDPVLTTFLQVFNNHLGYYGEEPFVANMERQLDEDGHLEDFKKAFKDQSGKEWVDRRHKYNVDRVKIIRALSKVLSTDEDSARETFEGFKSFSLSPEQFAKYVKSYLDKKGPEFRLNFFVDEFGKFCEDDIQRMMNFQTIAESFATICNGRAWIFATSQQAISSIVEGLQGDEGADFSRIQDRFSNRINLSGSSVDEVIHKRLLEKKPEAHSQLNAIYDREKNNFRTLYNFSEGGNEYKNYKDDEHFRNLYPFAPFHIELFGKSMIGLSRQNAFQGQYRAVGERSMLSVFQNVLKSVADQEIGQLPSFDKIFDGLQPTLNGQIQSSIISATRQLDEFKVKLLKTLFMVKYVKEFEPTLKHITSLMVDSYDVSLPDLEKKIREELGTLEYQSYIQSNGDRYEYLTNKEQDVINEIKAESLDDDKLSNEIGTIIFDNILKKRKIAHIDHSVEFGFTQMIDEMTKGRLHESGLTYKIITPKNNFYTNRDALIGHSMGKDEILMILPDNARIISDIQYYLQTNQYTKKINHGALTEELRSIIETEQRKNSIRKGQIKKDLESAVSEAEFLLEGKILKVKGSGGDTRMIMAFQSLLDKTFSNIKLLPVQKTEAEVKALINNPVPGELKSETLTPAAQEVYNYTNLRKSDRMKTYVKDLLDHFKAKPYGWSELSILYVIGEITKKSKGDLHENETTLSDTEIANKLTNNRLYNSLYLETGTVGDAQQIKKFKTIYKDFCLTQAPSNDPKVLVNSFKDKLTEEVDNIISLKSEVAKYPFLSQLDEGLSLLRDLGKKDRAYFFNEISAYEDPLLDFREQIYDPIRQFMTGPSVKLFDGISEFINSNSANLRHVDQDKTEQLRDLYNSPDIYKGAALKNAKGLLDECKAELKSKIAEQRKASLAAVLEKKKNMQVYELYKAAAPEMQDEQSKKYDQIIADIEKSTNLDSISAMRNDAVENLPFEIEKALKLASGKEIKETARESIRSISVSIGKSSLESEADVDQYTAELNKKLKVLIKNNKHISI